MAEIGQQKYPRTIATAGLVIAPTNDTWRTTQRVTAVHITDGNAIGATSVYPMELLALTAAIQLAIHIHTPITDIVTDAKGVCMMANKLAMDQQATPTYTSIFGPLAAMVKNYQGAIRWTKAHAERRDPNPENWTRDECLNHLADKVAGGSLDFDIETAQPTRYFVVTAKEILDSMQLPGTWKLLSTNGTIPPLDKLQQHINEHRLRRYLERRDTYRAEDPLPRPPRWQQTTPLFAAALFSQTQTTITRASHNVKLIWDKHYTGQNQAKGIANLEERRLASKCPLCDNIDTQHHWIRE